MLGKKWILPAVTAGILILLIILTGVTFSWFRSSASAGARAPIGEVAVSIPTARFDLGDPLSEDYVREQTFIVENDSSIGSYIRLGYTLMFCDDEGNPLPNGIPDGFVEVRLTSLSIDGSPVNNLSQACVTERNVNNYCKQFIELLGTASSGQDSYLMIPAGQGVRLEGKLALTYNFAAFPKIGEDFDAVSQGRLHLVLIPEAVQASGEAVAAAAEYGWDSLLVGEEIQSADGVLAAGS